uniref:Amino acid permease/ SLC12A domain-containing protein n=1 Tax=Spongospora subterranea TaxID=70186 RepID=A0A0H5R2W4_9EUKA|eukprot:CRZ02254.1 hypothetical protein [Spongospora subterranea]
MMPESGGEQVYLQTSYSRPRDLMPFLFCWVMILCIRPGSEAADCIVVSKYIMFPFNSGLNQNVVQQRLIAMAAISLITAINISNTRIAILIHDVITVLKIAVVTIIALTGVLIAVQLVKIDNRPNNFAHPFAGTDNRPGSYASACFRVFFAYDGWNNLNYSVAELKDPEKCLPRASAMGVGLVTILFLAANFAYFTVVPLDKIVSSSELLAGQFFIAVFGDFVGSKIFPVLLAMSALGAVSAMAFSASRIILASAKAGIIPKSEYLSAVHPYFKTPTRAFILNWALSMILIAIPPSEDAFDFLLELVGYPQWVFYGKRKLSSNCEEWKSMLCLIIRFSSCRIAPPAHPTT